MSGRHGPWLPDVPFNTVPQSPMKHAAHTGRLRGESTCTDCRQLWYAVTTYICFDKFPSDGSIPDCGAMHVSLSVTFFHTYLYAFCLLLPLRWWWIMMANWWQRLRVMSAFNVRSDWFVPVLITFWRAIHCRQRPTRKLCYDREAAWCRCKIWYVSKFAVASSYVRFFW